MFLRFYIFRSSSLWLVSLLLRSTYCFSAAEQITNSISSTRRANQNNFAQQHNYETAPAFPILEIGYHHIINQIGANGTAAWNASIASNQKLPGLSGLVPLHTQASPRDCGPGSPCIDGSCCNTEGKCGFRQYNCQTTAAIQCLSNCDASAKCGINSPGGNQTCALNLCCSYLGYCGTSDLYCVNADPLTGELPCQEGYGSCEVRPAPSCDAAYATTSRGRKVAYYRAANVFYLNCNRITSAEINTTNLSHLIFAFVAIDPLSFAIVPTHPENESLYFEFTSLKTKDLETWVGVGGFDFSNPGLTFTTWSDMCLTSISRAAFIDGLLIFMANYGFDGVDLDWEFPTVSSRGGRTQDLVNFNLLVREMRGAFGDKYGLSVTLPPDFSTLSGFSPVSLQPYVDFFNFMAYDLHGPWEASYLGAFIRPQASILDISKDLAPLWFDGLQGHKVNLGVAYYGRGFKLANKSCTCIGCPYTGLSNAAPCTRTQGIASLREIKSIIAKKGLTPKLLKDELMKQITWDDQWIAYDDEETVSMKDKWADSHCLGGTAIWSIDLNSGVGSDDLQVVPTTAIDNHPPRPTNIPEGNCGGLQGISCLGSSSGNCCSQSNWCGSDSAHCAIANGCQNSFGSCTSAGVIISTDATCGDGKTCQGSIFGNCCSTNGFCGSTLNYCSVGCQTAWGICK